MSEALGIVGLVIVAVFIPLSVLANGDTVEANDDTQASGRPFLGFRWLMRGHGGGGGFIEAVAEKLDITDGELQEAAVRVKVEDMADELGLTEDEVAQITPIVQGIADLREQLEIKPDELRAAIGDRLDAYRESMTGSRKQGMCGGCCVSVPFEGSSEKEPAEPTTFG
jgi:hypothetical protein